MWEHRSLIACQKAHAAAVDLGNVARTALATRRDLAWQLQRASASIVLNIAEGADEIAPLQKTQFYRIARRSAAECDAILDIMSGNIGEGFATSRAQLLEVRVLLNGLVRRTETSNSQKPSAQGPKP